MKVGERQHMERVLRREEGQLHLAESQLKLAQQAFDQFLQEKDRKAVEAQRRYVKVVKEAIYVGLTFLLWSLCCQAAHMLP